MNTNEEDQSLDAYCFNFNGPNSTYVKLISKDLHVFIVRREHAVLSGTIRALLSYPIPECQTNEILFHQIPSRVLEKVCLYLVSKAKYVNDLLSETSMFTIEPDIAVEVLMAATFLDC